MPESMRRRLARYAIVAAIVLVVGGLFVQREILSDNAAANATAPLAEPLEIGAPAPDFTLQMLDGGTFRLSEARGQVVVLNFWASWCAPCRYEMPELQRLYESRLDGGDLLVVAVNAAYDDPGPNAERFIEEFGLTFPIPVDTTRNVANRYGVRGLPATFFIDAEGILRARTYGPIIGERLAESVAAAGG